MVVFDVSARIGILNLRSNASEMSMFPQIGTLEIEEDQERLKIILPLKRNRLLLSLFSLLIVVWLAMTVAIIAAMLREHYTWLLNLMLLIWLGIWAWFGRVLWRRWQFFAAGREILFINHERLILRRPLSLLGPTDAYDMKHVTPFYRSDLHSCPTFDYAFQHVYFGQSLPVDEATQLIAALNRRFFAEDEED